ncbi:MAG: glycosyltransferase family 2 protein [Verrucomicrobiia bacterium]
MIIRRSKVGRAPSLPAGKSPSPLPAAAVKILSSGGMPQQPLPPPGKQTACVITCHNYGRYLAACVESCLAQTVPFAVIVVVDDASTDDTRVVAQRFAGRGVRYLRGEWKNFSHARNAGAAALPRTAFLLFVDADNILSKSYHELLLAGFNAPNVGAVYGNIYYFNDAGEFIGYSPYIKPHDYHQLRINNYADACALMRREAFDQMRGWADGAYLTDWMMWLEMTRHGWHLRFIPNAILNYRVHEQQMSWERFGLWEPHIDPLRRSCLTAIVTLFSGRRWVLERYERWLRALQWERPSLHVAALDNSGDAAYGEALRAMLGRSGLAYSYMRDGSRAVPEVSSDRFTDSRLHRSRHAYALAAHLARLYATARQHVPAATDFIWTVEEDIEPPADALHHLCLGMFQHKRAGVVTGAARSRFENRWLLWSGDAALPAPPARLAYVPVDATGFYCALFRRPVWDALAFRPTRDWSVLNCAYDWAAMHDVIKNGWQVMVSGSVICKHWQENGTFV